MECVAGGERLSSAGVFGCVAAEWELLERSAGTGRCGSDTGVSVTATAWSITCGKAAPEAGIRTGRFVTENGD